MADDAPGDVITVEAAAARLHVTEKTLRRWVKEGRLNATKPGRRLLIKRADVDALVNGSSQTPASDAPGTSSDGAASQVHRPFDQFVPAQFKITTRR